MQPQLRLFHYWRSSASWRVRWALELKGLKPEMVAVSLLDGESESPHHRARNPLGYVPVLERVGETLPHRRYLAESLAILEWLNDQWPSPPLLPADSWDRARARQLFEIINAGTQPIQNLTVVDRISADPTVRNEWMAHWTDQGLHAFETVLKSLPEAGPFCMGTQPTLADLALIPQCYNALRFGLDLNRYRTVKRVYEYALSTPECQAAHPDRYAPVS